MGPCLWKCHHLIMGNKSLISLWFQSLSWTYSVDMNINYNILFKRIHKYNLCHKIKYTITFVLIVYQKTAVKYILVPLSLNIVAETSNVISIILMSFGRKFVFFNIPQIQYKNTWVQIMMFKNMTPSPFLRFYLGKIKILIGLSWCRQLCGHILLIFFCFFIDDGEQVLVDLEGKDYKEITQHVKKILGKSE